MNLLPIITALPAFTGASFEDDLGVTNEALEAIYEKIQPTIKWGITEVTKIFTARLEGTTRTEADKDAFADKLQQRFVTDAAQFTDEQYGESTTDKEFMIKVWAMHIMILGINSTINSAITTLKALGDVFDKN